MLMLSGFELFPRWVPLAYCLSVVFVPEEDDLTSDRIAFSVTSLEP